MNIFVFGSNLAGRHGKGAALHAMRHCGASYGQGEGLQGQSYAIPTKDGDLRPLSVKAISAHVAAFLDFATSRPDLLFEVTRVGCGLAGNRDEDIAPLFRGHPPNVHFFEPSWATMASRPMMPS